MEPPLPVLPSDRQTIAELRELYRAAEARAARLRLLSVAGRELGEAEAATIDAVVQRCADRLALFVGRKGATIGAPDDLDGIPVRAPGIDGEVLATIRIDGLPTLDAIRDGEDREAFRMHLDMIATTLDRISKEREKAALLDTLTAREKTLEALLDRVFTAQEEERRRVSHELHDGVAQTATALARLLEGSADRQREDGGSDSAISHAEVARGLVAELRRVIAGLRPTLLDDLGLVPALRSLADGLEAAGYRVAFHCQPCEERLAPALEIALYRVAQEAITNIQKHAGGPCDVIIEVDLRTEAKPRLLRVTDLGGGPAGSDPITPTPYSGSKVGIEVMKERMAAIGGALDWRAGHPRGVVVEARLAAGA